MANTVNELIKYIYCKNILQNFTQLYKKNMYQLSYIEACNICQRTKIQLLISTPYHSRIHIDYSSMDILLADINFMLKGYDYFKYLLVATCEIINVVLGL